MEYRGHRFWLFIEHEDHSFQTSITGRSFDSDWLRIEPDGQITVKGSREVRPGVGGYAWDGCSPKRALFDIVFGTPDGVVDPLTEKRKTYFASMVHDALYQYGQQTGVTRREADRLFYEMLEGFQPRRLYHWAVRLFAGAHYDRLI